MHRVFADANVLIAGAGSPSGASRAVLTMAEIGLFRLVVCRQVLDESERNLRKKLPAALPLFAQMLAVIELEILPDPPEPAIRTWAAVIDTDDAPILAAAVLAKVDRLLTLNSKHFTPPVAEASRLIIQTPGDFVQNLRAVITGGMGQRPAM